MWYNSNFFNSNVINYNKEVIILKLYTVKEVSQILKMNVNSVYELINSGELKAIKGVGRIKISEDDLKEFLETKQERVDVNDKY